MQKAKAVQALFVMHTGLLLSVVILGGVMLWLVSSGTVQPSSPELDRPLQIVALIAGVVGFFGGAAIFKKRLQAVRDMTGSLSEKWKAYFTICLLQWALLEGPALLCMIFFFLTGNYAFLILGGMLLLMLALQAPTKAKIMLQLGMSEDDLNSL